MGDIYEIKAYAKVNIFLKITGHKDGYHTLLSRFVRIDNLYDIVKFVPFKSDEFIIDGCENIETTSNTIYKAYTALYEYTQNQDIIDFFKSHKVVVEKNIPSQAGLGGGSSDSASFIRLVNQICNLNLSVNELSQIGSKIGADLPFFIHNFNSANVSGFGEIVEEFKEEVLNIKIFTPPIGCDTTAVFKKFKKDYLEKIDLNSFENWENIPSKELVDKIKEPKLLNDLYMAGCDIYPKLKDYEKKGWYFSGSGSSFFIIC
ncbi:4-diphosphocytidyl-2-C-methyl-D-erythritol kinase [hydrothermal vent metagenome]|uniref:4-diphosphocytidyl-2-C-methyl-D-erythritol kinase n=1 Tax=hydrothermal vent metagenome TaxID=652676 RepID=A0A1W1BRB4_9ZZZZ